MRVIQAALLGGPGESSPEQSEAVGERHAGGGHCKEPHDPPPVSGQLEERIISLLLGDEPQKWWEAGHGHRRQGGENRSAGHHSVEPGEFADVPAPGLLVDHPDQHEQSRFEQRVGEGVQAGHAERLIRADTDQRDDPAELADRGVGQQGLQVVLLQGEDGTDDGGRQPDGDQHRRPPPEVGEGL